MEAAESTRAGWFALFAVAALALAMFLCAITAHAQTLGVTRPIAKQIIDNISSGSAGTGAGNQPGAVGASVCSLPPPVVATPAQPDETIIRPCPACEQEGESSGLATELICPFCGWAWTVASQKRNSGLDRSTATHEKRRADFEIRTRDLRFTKPLSRIDKEALSSARRRFPRLSSGELLRSGAYDDRKRRAAVTNSLQRIEDTRQALADHVAHALGVRDARAPKPGCAQ